MTPPAAANLVCVLKPVPRATLKAGRRKNQRKTEGIQEDFEMILLLLKCET